MFGILSKKRREAAKVAAGQRVKLATTSIIKAALNSDIDMGNGKLKVEVGAHGFVHIVMIKDGVEFEVEVKTK